ncbi:MAG: DUF4105 domain-containing protein [Deltaproteobacteria bacterium]
MKSFLWIFLSFLPSISLCADHASNVVSRTRVSRPQGSSVCPGYESNDPFSLNVRYDRGPRFNECMNLFDYRPAHLLSPQEAKPYAEKAKLPAPKEGEIWVANVWHRGKFWVVKIPEWAVEDVMLQIERFDPNVPVLDSINKRRWFAAHAQVRFKLKTGKEAIFIPQKTDDESETLQLSNLVFSSEAVRPKGEAFGPVKGNRDHYGLAKRLVSLEEVIDVSLKKLKHQLAQYPIKMMGPEEKWDEKRQAYLLSGLTRADHDWKSYREGKPVFYNTKQRNCLSDAIDIFDEVTDYSSLTQAEESIPETSPRQLVPALAKRGLLTRQKHPTLNTEFGYPNY